jgi:hypothetical protein
MDGLPDFRNETLKRTKYHMEIEVEIPRNWQQKDFNDIMLRGSLGK